MHLLTSKPLLLVILNPLFLINCKVPTIPNPFKHLPSVPNPFKKASLLFSPKKWFENRPGGPSKLSDIKTFIPTPPNPEIIQRILKNIQGTEADLTSSRNYTTPLSKEVNLGLPSLSDARKFYFLSGAAYCDDKTLFPWTCRQCKKYGDLEINKVYVDPETGGRFFSALDHANKYIILSFAGAMNLRNYLRVAMPELVPIELGGRNDFKVQKGYKEIFENLAPICTPLVNDLISKHPNYKLIMTGHSLGGQTSSLMALHLQQKLNIPSEKINLYTYGQPRLGDQAYVDYMNSQTFVVGRVTNNADLFAHINPRSKGYYHHHNEIYLVGDQEHLCRRKFLEDPNCSLHSEPTLNLFDHIYYYGDYIATHC